MGKKEKLRERFLKMPSDFTFDEMQSLLQGYGYEEMNTMTYKGYLGSVAYSEKDNVFFGKIEGIDGMVNFEGESVAELTQAFHEAVDDYLAYCEDEGIQPTKTYSGVLHLHIAPETHRRLAMFAKKEGMSLNSFVNRELKNKTERAFA
jgi:predicted HicB family RNase H-like nuclease